MELLSVGLLFILSMHMSETKKTVSKMLTKQEKQIAKDLFHLQAQRFACSADAQMALKQVMKHYTYFSTNEVKISSFESHCKRGRPTAGAIKKLKGYKIEASFSVDQHSLDREIEQRSCYVLATNIPEEKLAAPSVITEYKGQDCVEKCFAFLKSPSFLLQHFYEKRKTYSSYVGCDDISIIDLYSCATSPQKAFANYPKGYTQSN
jgi:hypothetical protein